MFFNDLFEDDDKSLKKNNPCWKGYHPVGTKEKAGKTVPNCVPEDKELEEQLDETFHFQGYQIDVNPATKILTVSRNGQVLHTEKTSMVGRPGGAESIKRRVSTIIDRLEDEKYPDDLEVREDKWQTEIKTIPPKVTLNGVTFEYNKDTNMVQIFKGGKMVGYFKYTGPKNYSNYRATLEPKASELHTGDSYVGPASRTVGQYSEKPSANPLNRLSLPQDVQSKVFRQHDIDTSEIGDISYDNAAKWSNVNKRKKAKQNQGVEEDTKSELYANAVEKIKKALSNPKLDPATRKEYEARLAKFESLNEINYQRVLPGVRSAGQELGKRYLKQYNDIIARGGQRLRPTYPSAIGATIAATVIPRGNVTEILGVVQRKDDSRTAFQVAFNQAGSIVEKHLEGLSRSEIEAVYHNLSVANQVLPAGENVLLEPQAEDINESLVLEFAKTSQDKRAAKKNDDNDEEAAQKDPTLSYHGRNPEVRNLLRQAYKDFPSADNDIEAVFASVGKQRKITDKHFKQVDTTVQRQQNVLRSVNQELANTEEELKKTEKENARQEGDIRKLIKSVGDANRRYDDQERRFRSYTARVAKGEITPQMKAIAQGAQEVERQSDVANNVQQQPQQQVRAGMYDKDIPVTEAGITLVAKHYFTPYGTLPNELINNFGFKKDNRGWYLPQWNTSSRNFDRLFTQARRAFGDPQTTRLNEAVEPNRAGFNPSGTKDVWQAKIRNVQVLQNDPALQDEESQQAIADRLGELQKEGINNGWM